MKQDEIIEMWKSVIKYAPSEVRITEFAKLVAAKEREVCAKVLLDSQLGGIGVAVRAAYLIRARGEQE